ncbi:hypothetical protein [Pseudonocardia sp. TRM90224]|uniref:hypothetical protein n=1 Tax=Pseudonocardia sp. TRM90224 TaxID=2812678 RepID=UPI001E289184|nr:hypothetical protein [Pseudonocardia sp. TRM90224]
MSKADLSLTQRLVTALLPARSAAIEAESREWRTSCECGHEFSVWDAGGVRFKAAGSPTVAIRCPSCRTVARRSLTRTPPAG